MAARSGRPPSCRREPRTLRALASRLDDAPLLTLHRWAGDDTWSSPRVEECRAQLGGDQARVRAPPPRSSATRPGGSSAEPTPSRLRPLAATAGADMAGHVVRYDPDRVARPAAAGGRDARQRRSGPRRRSPRWPGERSGRGRTRVAAVTSRRDDHARDCSGWSPLLRRADSAGQRRRTRGRRGDVDDMSTSPGGGPARPAASTRSSPSSGATESPS